MSTEVLCEATDGIYDITNDKYTRRIAEPLDEADLDIIARIDGIIARALTRINKLCKEN